jgi:hypothetical protein
VDVHNAIVSTYGLKLAPGKVAITKNEVLLAKLGLPELWFKLQTAEPNLRFRSSSGPVLHIGKRFGSRFSSLTDLLNLLELSLDQTEPHERKADLEWK